MNRRRELRLVRNAPQPPRSSSTSMREAPASREFSTSSLITEAGRSITSPAAIWLMSSSLRTWMDTGHLAHPLRALPFSHSAPRALRDYPPLSCSGVASSGRAVPAAICAMREPAGGSE